MRRVIDHVETSFRFCRLAHSSLSANASVCLSTSSITTGSVGTQDQRFLTVFGPCVQVVHMLAPTVAALEHPAVYCPCTTHVVDGRLRKMLLPIEKWSFLERREAPQQFVIYEVDFNYDERMNDGMHTQSESCWSDAYERIASHT
ncbi:hypothetical protein DIPPA_25168 [Diplonema papillatum]|nr:hypothetical protein DIPPA_25168 [Diplonema papillatum]